MDRKYPDRLIHDYGTLISATIGQICLFIFQQASYDNELGYLIKCTKSRISNVSFAYF